MIAILMGVTSSGKSTIAAELVKLTGWEFAEGDDFHSAANKQKMKSGIPLNDADRAPWLASLHNVILSWIRNGENGVMSCSALKQSYRDILIAGTPESSCRFVLLDVPANELVRRIRSRAGHFMNPDLLKSQLDTLELPHDALRVDATGSPADIAKTILIQLAPEQVS
jgi:gluconokinase